MVDKVKEKSDKISESADSVKSRLINRKCIKKRDIIILIFMFLSSISFFYEDTLSVSLQGLRVWRALFDGRFFQYYTCYGSGYGIIMNIVCLDMEGVLVPEIWIAFAEASGIPELKRTTRDERQLRLPKPYVR